MLADIASLKNKLNTIMVILGNCACFGELWAVNFILAEKLPIVKIKGIIVTNEDDFQALWHLTTNS